MKSILLILILYPFILFSQKEKFNDARREDKGIRVVFYNVENLFDTIDDPKKNDNEYLPTSKKKWNSAKYWSKQKSIAQTLIAVGGWEAPDIIGLSEVENRQVLINLIRTTTLKKFNYEIIQYDSPDERGIDVAMLYRPDKFRVLNTKAFPVIFPGKIKPTTRDILYVKGVVLNKDTIHVFVNHWPSRRGGQQKSEPLRKATAAILRTKVDSVLKIKSSANILIMGDLNDEPDDISIAEVLKAKQVTTSINSNDLIDLMSPIKKEGKGTLLFKDKIGIHWYTFDQFIVSSSLLNNQSHIFVSPEKAQVFNGNFLFKEKEDGTKKLNRTYEGPRYTGGFSDHLPVYLDLMIK